MYIFPGYVTYTVENENIIVFSKLFQNKIKISSPDVKTDFTSIFTHGGCNSLSSPLTKLLHDQGMLIEEAETVSILEEVKNFLTEKLLLTIMPTEACNFRCPYCYEIHNSTTMSDRILLKILQYINKQAIHVKDINIFWFGGEPTLCKEIILQFSSQIISMQKKYGFRYNGSMTTNGYLLTPEAFLQYYEAGINSYQITIDGWQHDKFRPHCSGKGSLNEIIANLNEISRLPEEKYNFEIILRRNIMPEDRDFSWYDYLKSQFGKDKRFLIAPFPVSNWGGETVNKLNLFWNGTQQKLLKEHEDYLAVHGLQQYKCKNELFSGICYASCPYGLVFRPDGRIEKCTVALGHPKNLVGIVDPVRGVQIDTEANSQWCTSKLKPQCLTCDDILNCLNVCCRKGVVINGHTDGFCKYSHDNNRY